MAHIIIGRPDERDAQNVQEQIPKLYSRGGLQMDHVTLQDPVEPGSYYHTCQLSPLNLCHYDTHPTPPMKFSLGSEPWDPI